MEKIDLNKLAGRQIATDNEPEIPYGDIEMIALKVNKIIDLLDGLSFEKKEETCHCEEMTCKINCTKNHTCHAYSCEKCNRGLEYRDSEEQKPFSVDNPPKEGEDYWYVENDARYGFDISLASYHEDGVFPNKMLSQNNCFRTREEAEAALKRVLQALKS